MSRIDDVKFVQEYISAIRRKMTTKEFAKKIGVSYIRVIQRKKKIADMTGKKLPPLLRNKKVVDVNKISRLVNSSYCEHKKVNAKQ